MSAQSNFDISNFARTNFRNEQHIFGVRQADRLSHIYIIGKTGTGKSTLLETLVRQDLEAGRGFALIDPHGDLVERVARAIPSHRSGETTYLNVPDQIQPYGYNPLRRVREDKIPLAASGLLEAMKKLWSDAWGVRMEHILRNALYALLERQDSTLADVLRLLNEKKFRARVSRSLRNETVKRFWIEEYGRYSERYRVDAIAPVQNKIGALLTDPTLKRIFTSPQQDIRIRKLMDDGGVLLVNLAKGQLGEDSSILLGSMLVSTLGLAAFSRADVGELERKPFYIYIDELQSFATLSLANMLSELRKYGVGMILANQHLHQLEPEIRHAILGNAGTLVSFRVGPEDAAFLAREFQPKIEPIDLLSLPNHTIYLKLMIDGTPSQPFSATTINV